MNEESIIAFKNKLFDRNNNYMDFKDVLKTYFKDQCPYLMKMSIKESDYGSEREGNSNEFIAVNPTIGYTGLIEKIKGIQMDSVFPTVFGKIRKSDNSQTQDYFDSLFILESVTKLFNDLDIKAKNVYNPFINTLNTMYIRDNMHYYIYVDQVSKNRIIVVTGRFGFYEIKTHKSGIYEDGMTLPSK